MRDPITLSGLVLPVGGIKEKVLAARRNGVKTVVLPRDNEADLRELPGNVREEMHIALAERIEDVLRVTLPEVAGRMRLRNKRVLVQRQADSDAERDILLQALRSAIFGDILLVAVVVLPPVVRIA